MIFIVTIESLAGQTGEKEYECRSPTEALLAAREELANYPDWIVTTVKEKGGYETFHVGCDSSYP